MSIKKIYITYPEREMFEDEKARRQDELLEIAGEYLHEPVEAIRKYDAEIQHSELEQLGESIKQMSKADYVLISGNWRSERRSKLEAVCAIEYMKPILMEDGNKLEEVT